MRYDDASHNGSTEHSGPVARPDVENLPSGTYGPASGNAITGAGTASGAAGADQGGASIVEVHGAGGQTVQANGAFQANGQYGILSMTVQGDFQYVRNPGTPEGVRDVFSYTVADADGATANTTITVVVGQTGAAAAIQNAVALPAGVELSDIHVNGRDLVINMPDGTQMVIPGGAIFVPDLTIGDVQIPPSNLAALLIDNEPKPAAGPNQLSSGGNFADPVPPLDPGAPLGDLIPPTVLPYQPPEFQQILDAVAHKPTILIETPDNPAGAVDAQEEVFEKGLPTRNGGEPAGSGEIADGNSSNNSDPSETNTGTIVFEAADGLKTITVDGVAITNVGQQIQGQFGVMTITGIDIPAGQITYSYTLTDNTSGDNTHDIFTVVVTDKNNDTATGTLTVNIIDDVPTAHNDTDSTDLVTHVATGNVITGAGTDGGTSGSGVDVLGADNAHLTAIASNNVPANTDNTADGSGNFQVAGQFGTLTINADGTYTYTANQGAPGGSVEVFTYTLTDGDGDTSTATLTITNPDHTPTAGSNLLVQLDDDALPGGNPGGPGDTPDAVNTTGTLSGSGGDGALTFALSTSGAPSGFAYQLQANGDLWVLQGSTHVLTVTVNSATGAYNVSQVAPIMHPAGDNENNVNFSITYTVTDADGDSASSTLQIQVNDDTPIARNDTDAVDLQSHTAVGNVVTGVGTTSGSAGADSAGADGGGHVTGLSSNNVSGHVDNDPSGGFVVVGQYGTLTMQADGSYSYAQNAQVPGGVSDVFTYSYTDADGDTVTATLTITNPDHIPTVVIETPDNPAGAVNATESVNEKGLPERNGGEPAGSGEIADGNGSNNSDPSETNTGTIVFTAQDGVGSVTVNGTAITTVGQVVHGQFGDMTITSINMASGQIGYSYTLLDNTSGDNTSDKFTVVVTDTDGDKATGTLTVNIIDDKPTAANDTDALIDTDLTTTGNVITTVGTTDPVGTGVDIVGADNAHITAIQGTGGTDTSFTNGLLEIQGAHGTLTMDADGNYTYTRANGDVQAGTDTFTYTLTDGDGDTSTATLTITLPNINSIPQMDTPQNVSVDEDGLPNGNTSDAGQTNPTEVAHGDNATDTGQVVVDFGNDRPANPLAAIEFINVANLNNQLTQNGDPITFSVDGSGHLIGQVNGTGPAVITIEITGAVNGSGGTVTYSYEVILADHIDQAFGDQTEGGVNLTGIDLQVTDSNGDTAHATFTATIYDDVPSAEDFAVTQQGENDPVVVSLAGHITPGADGVDLVHGVNGSLLTGTGQLTYDGSTGQFTYTPSAGETGDVTFSYTITDGDGDHITKTVTIHLTSDSVPTPTAQVAYSDDDGLANGNPASTTGDIDANQGEKAPGNPSEAIYNGQLVVDFHNDAPGTITFANLDGTSGTVGTETVNYSWNAATDTLTATTVGGTRPGTVLFDIHVTNEATGDYTLTQHTNILQAPGGNETSAPDVVLHYLATDSDGSTSTAGTLTITFNDDAPTVKDQSLSIGTVYEDGLNNANAHGNLDGGSQPVSQTFNASALAALVNPGADGLGSVSLNGSISGATGLTQNGVAIDWLVVDATHLQGVVHGTANVVFTLTNNGNGTFTFTLLDNIDNHPNAAGDSDVDTLQLGNAFIVTDGDGDPVSLNGHVSVDIQNDVPILSGQNVSFGIVYEDGLNNANAVGNLDGGSQPVSQTISASAIAAAVTPGADGPVAISLNGAISGATGLTQNGTAIDWQVVDATHLQGVVHGTANVVFTLTDNGNGTFTFTLLDNIDNHPNAAGDSDVDTLALGNAFVATDTDGDQVSLNGHVSVDIQNDVPITNGQNVSFGIVYEDGLNNANAHGNLDGGSQPVTQTINASAIAALVTPGADSPVTISLNGSISGATGLTQNGTAIDWQVVDATHLQGVVHGTSNVVFTLTNNGNGTFTFTLLDNIDNHPNAAGDSDVDTLQLGAAFVATDTDGDPVSLNGHVSVDIQNDVPIANGQNLSFGIVYEDGLNNANAHGNLDGGSQPVSQTINASALAALVSPGADSPVTISLNGAISGATGLTQNGTAIDWQVVDATHLQGVVHGTSNVVFTLTNNGNGTFTFTLLDNIDNHPNAAGDSDVDTLALGAAFIATDTDGDQVSLSGHVSVDIQNDVPILSGQNVSFGIVYEDGLNNANAVGNLDGGSQPVSQTINASAIAAAVTPGADGPVTISLNGSISGATGLTQNGTAIDWQVVDATHLQGVVHGTANVVFTLTNNGNGTFTFTLLDNIDNHPNAAGDSDVDTLALGNAFIATDTDGDQVSLNGHVSVDIQNDVPIANGQNLSFGIVYEDGLNNANAHGNLDGGSQPVTQTINASALAALVSPGADSPVTISLNGSISGATGLTQNGTAIDWQVVDATHLQGVVHGTANVVFTLTNNGNGTFTFTLLDNIDNHPNAAGDSDVDTLALGAAFIATDTDGDQVSLSGHVSVDIQNDVPIIGTIQPITTDNDPTDTNATIKDGQGSLHLSMGADGFASVTIAPDLSGITVGGLGLVGHQNGLVYTAYVDVNGNHVYDAGTDVTPVFTITVDPTGGPSGGTYTFDLLAALDPTITPFDIGAGSSFGVGPSQSVIVTDNATSLNLVYVTGWAPAGGFSEASWLLGNEAAVTQTSNVNGSTAGWGLANNNFDAGEFMRFDFGTLNDYDAQQAPDGPYSPPGGVTIQNVAYATFSFKNFDVGDKIEFVAHFTNGNTQTYTAVDGAVSSLTITAPGGTQIAWIDVYESTGSIKLNLDQVGVFNSTIDKTIPVSMTFTDTDGDSVTGAGSIHVTNNGTATTPNAPINPNAPLTTMSLATTSLVSSNDNQKTHGGNNTALMGAVAAAGLAELDTAAAAHPASHSLDRGIDLSALHSTVVSQSVAGSGSHGGHSGGSTLESALVTAHANEAASHGNHAHEAAVNSAKPVHGALQHDGPGALDQGTHAPAHSDAGASHVTAPAILMPSAQQLVAAGHGQASVEGKGAQHNEVVGKVLADALHGGEGHGPNIDALVNNLPDHGQEHGARAVLEALATHGPHAVPMGHTAFAGVFGGANSMHTEMHHDAAPAHG